MVWITKAEYIEEYLVWLAFNDGVEGVVDLRPVVFGDHRKLFKEIQDPSRFRKFKVAMDTVVWDNGLDLAPEFLRNLLSASVEPRSAAH